MRFAFCGLSLKGGRDLKGTATAPKNVSRSDAKIINELICVFKLRTAPQSSDQTYENNGNAALKVSIRPNMHALPLYIVSLENRNHWK